MSEFKLLANQYGKDGRPFLFLVDFETQKPFCCPLGDLEKEGIYFSIHGQSNDNKNAFAQDNIAISFKPMSFQDYSQAFHLVQKYLNAGDTYLINLCYSTPISLRFDSNMVSNHKENINSHTSIINSLFLNTQAPYKLLFKDQFTLFSPECFVRTQNGHIFSYPMKGTIDANIPDAAKIIMTDKKEIWEHNTIVDLIRNDLAMVSSNIEVTKYRFITEVHSHRNDLLQVSSEIRGELNKNWHDNIGDILCALLPAGSISGAPKKRTLEIIREAEKEDRGYFTGVFGIFDGKELDSAVNIRYVEKTKSGLQFRSGGGITAMSKAKAEYEEMVNKVYVPIS